MKWDLRCPRSVQSDFDPFPAAFHQGTVPRGGKSGLLVFPWSNIATILAMGFSLIFTIIQISNDIQLTSFISIMYQFIDSHLLLYEYIVDEMILVWLETIEIDIGNKIHPDFTPYALAAGLALKPSTSAWANLGWDAGVCTNVRETCSKHSHTHFGG